MRKRELFDNARSYALYYGYGCEGELSQFDVVIVEPAARSRDALDSLRAHKDIVVLGYLSALEPQPGQDMSAMKAQDWLTVNGVALQEAVTGNPILDPRSRRCRERIARQANTLMRGGFDGIFLDTIGDVDLPQTKMDDEIMLAARGLVAVVRDEWPDAIICQNSGLERLRHFTVDLIDAFCWENYNRAPRTDWFQGVEKWLSGVPDVRKLLLGESTDPCVLSEGDRQMALAGLRPDCMSYLAPQGYVSGVNTSWLDRLRELRC